LIILSFPENPKEAAEFQNRREDNLPIELRGVALWTIRQNFAQSSYTILGPGGVWVPVEYINNQWYYTYWSQDNEVFWTNKTELIKDLNRCGLGTLAEPYQTQQEKRKDTSSDEDQTQDDQLESSREKTPILQRYGVDRSEYSLYTETQLLTEVDDLTKQLKETKISPQQRLNNAIE
jgi:hypothetical protein